MKKKHLGLMIHKTVEMKFNQERKWISGLACQGDPTIGYIINP